jgi:hypothetical protein
MNHSTRSTRCHSLTTATRAAMVHSIGADLHVAFPNWSRNTAADFAGLYS